MIRTHGKTVEVAFHNGEAVGVKGYRINPEVFPEFARGCRWYVTRAVGTDAQRIAKWRVTEASTGCAIPGGGKTREQAIRWARVVLESHGYLGLAVALVRAKEARAKLSRRRVRKGA